jgi:BMFP domain-containing protein YqiC
MASERFEELKDAVFVMLDDERLAREIAVDRLKHQVQAVLDRQTDTNELKRTLEKLAKRAEWLDQAWTHLDEALVTTQEEFERQLLQMRVKQSALESRIEQLEADAATTRNALRVAITGPRVFVVEEQPTAGFEVVTPSASSTASGCAPSDPTPAGAPVPVQSPAEGSGRAKYERVCEGDAVPDDR